MKKIVVINNDLNIGGIQKSLISFLEYLVRQGHAIDLVLWQKEGILEKEVPPSVTIIERAYAITWKNILIEKGFIKKVKSFAEYLMFNFYAKIIKKPWLFYPTMKQQYNVAISYSQNGYPRFYTIDSVSADKKYLWFHHGAYDYTGATFKLDKQYYGKYNKIVTVSSANKQMLMEHFPEYSNKFYIVPNIIDIDNIIKNSQQKVSDINNTKGLFIFVTVTRFSKEKGIDLAIEIITELKKRGLQFKWYFIGDGETFAESKEVIQQRNLEDVCILLGNKENPYPYIKLADLYIQTSYVESQSITIYEALVLKKIILTTNLPALNDALQNGKLGVLCRPETACFVKNIENILYDKFAQTKLEKNIKKHLVSNEIAYKAIDKLF